MNLWLCFLISVFGGFSSEAFAQRKPCATLSLKNGRVRIRGGGRMAYFRCKKKFKRVGHKLAVCLSSGTWSQQTPVCVGRGCPDPGALPDVTVKELYKGGILLFSCPEGMRREGPQKLMCDGTNWDQEPPKCLYGASLGCDFEDSGLCGWSQDANDDFDWTWTSGFTPTIETGPEADHTTGSGHYIFMESSAPQKFGQVTRLISPPYQPSPVPMCVEFFYHMKGPPKEGEVGDLDVIIRTGTNDDPVDTVLFRREGYQGDGWVRGVVTIPDEKSVFKIVFAATRRQGWSGDIALDDIKVFNCSEMPEETTESFVSSPITTLPTTTTTTITTTTTPKPTIITTTPATTTTEKTTTTTPPTTITTTTTSSTTTPPITTTSTTPTTSTTTPSTTSSTTTSTSTWPSTPSSTMMTTTTMTSSTTSQSSSSASSSMMAYTTSASFTSTDTSSTTMTRPTYYPFTDFSSTTNTTPPLETKSTQSWPERKTSTSQFFSSSTTTPYSMSSGGFHNESGTSEEGLSGGGISGDNNTDTEQTFSSASPNISEQGQGGVGNERPSTEGGSTVSDYLPLIVGVSLGLAVGMVVVGVLAWLWARNRRKQKEIQIEEDQLNIIGSIDGTSYSYPPSGSEH